MWIRWPVYFFGAALVLAGLALAVNNLHRIGRGHTAAAWPVTAARMVACDLDALSDEGSDVYEATVRYEYAVDGVQYESTGIHPAFSPGGKEHVALYEKLKSATLVEAHYNPANPAEAYLLAGGFTGHLDEFAGAFLLIAFGALFPPGIHFAVRGNLDYAAGLVVLERR